MQFARGCEFTTKNKKLKTWGGKLCAIKKIVRDPSVFVGPLPSALPPPLKPNPIRVYPVGYVDNVDHQFRVAWPPGVDNVDHHFAIVHMVHKHFCFAPVRIVAWTFVDNVDHLDHRFKSARNEVSTWPYMITYT